MVCHDHAQSLIRLVGVSGNLPLPLENLSSPAIIHVGLLDMNGPRLDSV